MDKIIDVHTHPIFPEYLECVKKNGALHEDGFPIPTDYTIERQIELMDQAEVLWSCCWLSSPHAYFGDKQESIDLCRKINEKLADGKRRYPTRFGFGAAIPLPAVDAAIDEAVYALDILGADAVKIPSNSRGLYLGDKSMEPLFQELDKRGAVVVIHPHRPEPINETVWTSGPVPIYEFLADTTRAVLNYIANGFPIKYPNVKLVVPHNGSFLPNIYERMTDVVNHLEKAGKMDYIDVEEAFRKLWFDTSGNPNPNLEFLLTCADPTHIMVGSDYCFTPFEKAVEKLNDVREYIDGNLKLKRYKDGILRDNARELFHLSF